MGASLIATDETGSQPAEDFAVGDPVLAATAASLKDWKQAPVAFSSGTGESQPLFRISYGSALEPNVVFAHRDQLFLAPGEKLKRASRLVPGKDSLVLKDGTTAPVLAMELKDFNRGVHHIATSRTPAAGLGGHLIVVNGVVCGDYALQLAHLEENHPELLAEGHAQLPEFGSREYIAQHTHLMADEKAAQLRSY